MKEGVGLDTLKEDFERMLNQAEPNLLPLFFTWIDLRISRFRDQYSNNQIISAGIIKTEEGIQRYQSLEAPGSIGKDYSLSSKTSAGLDLSDKDGIYASDSLSYYDDNAGPINLSKSNKKTESKINKPSADLIIPSPTKEKVVDSKKSDDSKINECNICHKQFQYRSSYRRHMKIHQGIFSHLCDVCNRKFTRKEHYLRHKCNRRPNKPNRAGFQNVGPEENVSLPGVAKTPPKDDAHAPYSPGPVNNAVVPKSPKCESRRKSNKPRKVIPSITSRPADGLSDSGSDDEVAVVAPYDVPYGSHDNKPNLPFGNAHWATNPEPNLPVSNSSIVIPADIKDEAEKDFEESVLTLDSGSYKVQAVSSPSQKDPDQDDANSFIKVVKQGNYLKLKNQMHLVNGKLCFVCPNCHKVFHRSSNFSRHMRIHRGIYSYVCPTCHRGFFRKEHYQKHKCHRKSMSHIWNRKTKLDMDLLGTSIDDNCSSSNNDSEPGIDIDLHESGDSQMDNDSNSVLSCDGKEIES